MSGGQTTPTEARRTLPHNLDAECSVLGAILIANETWDVVASSIREEDFFRDAHRRIFRAMAVLHDANKPIDLILLREELETAGDLEEVGGPAYLASLVDGVPRSMNAEHYAGIIREKARLRATIVVANQLLAETYGAARPVTEILDETMQTLSTLAGTSAGVVSIGEAVDTYVARLDGPDATMLPTGLTDVDQVIGGLPTSRLTVIAARPRVGKTSLMLAMGAYLASLGTPVGLISLEMEPEALVATLVAQGSRISADRIRRQMVAGRDWQQIAETLARLHDRPLYFVTEGYTLVQIAAWARRLKDQYGIRVLFLDYLGLVGDLQSRDRQQEVAALSRGLKRLAQREALAVVALVQVRREAEQRRDKRPQLADLRESGAIEADADLVLLLYRDEIYHRDAASAPAGIAEIIIAKNRQGPVGTVKVRFTEETAQWANLARRLDATPERTT